MTVRISSEWLNACSGCEISIIDMGSRLLEALAVMEFVHIPALVDHKYFGQLGDQAHLRLPDADVGIVSGGIRNAEHLEVAEEMRRRCKVIIALGTCATHGGIPALCNSYTNDEIMAEYYATSTTDRPESTPDQDLPPLLERCYALDEKIAVDVYLPGCPPHADQIFTALIALFKGTAPALPAKSVCDNCPALRAGKGEVKTLKRFLHVPEYATPDEPLERMRCLLEQGFLCMGPVTRGGCGGYGNTPRCITARVPCRGCYGPVKRDGNQLLDMLNALASNGVDLQSLPDKASLLRFSGAHGRLRPTVASKEG